MKNSQLINVTVEVSEGIDPAEIVDAINRFTTGDDADGYTYLVSTPTHAVEGQPYRRGQDINVGRVTLIKDEA